MLFNVGTVCKYTFTDKFKLLDGVYLLAATTTFEQAVDAGIDFMKNLYTPAGLSSTDFADDYNSYAKSVVLELKTIAVGSTASVTYYVPDTILGTVPDPTVQRYPSISLGIQFGAFKDPTVYTSLRSQISDLISSVTGDSSALVWYETPEDAQWLTDAEYAALETQRAANIKAITPLQVVIKQKDDTIAQLKALNAELTAALVTLGGTEKT